MLAFGEHRDLVEVHGHGPPPTPVRSDELSDPAHPDRPRLVALLDLERTQQMEEVVDILRIQLHDLELRQQKIRDVQGVWEPVDPVAELQHVAHVEAIHDHVDRGGPVGRREVHLAVPVQGVEPAVTEESFGSEVLHHGLLRG